MTATEKRKEEQENLIRNRKNRILETAFKLFSEKGIDTIAITDIAKKAEIGVASVYRYFENKDEIAIRTAIWAWQEQSKKIMPQIEKEDFHDKNGFEQLKEFLLTFINLTENHKDFLRFIYFFDSYAVRQHIEFQQMKDYENEILFAKKYILRAVKKGMEDGSITKKYMGLEELLYFSLMHCLFSMAQKLSLSSSMLEIDMNQNPSVQLDFIIKMFLSELKND